MSKSKQIIIRGVVVVVGLALLLFVGGFIASWIFSSPVEEHVAEISARGEPTSIADLASEEIPADQDAAAILETIVPQVTRVSAAIESVMEQHPDFHVPFNELESAFLERVFEAHPDLIPALTRAARAPRYGVKIEDASSADGFIQARLDRGEFHRSIGRILSLRVKLLNDKGEHDAALETSIILFQLSRHFDREPSLMSYLVALATRNLAIASANATLREEGIADETQRDLEAELAKHDLQDQLRRALLNERAVGLQRFEEIVDGTGFWPVRLMRMSDFLDYLNLFEQYLEFAQQPFYEIAEKLGTAGNDLGTLASLSVPALWQSRVATAQASAGLRSLRVLNAIGPRPEAAGKIDVAELKLPADAITDPFSGKPLLLKETDAGLVVYSVGPDLVDDGGHLADGRDIGMAPVVRQHK